MKRKVIKENPLTTFRKRNEARMGRVVDSYPVIPSVGAADFLTSFPVRGSVKGAAMVSSDDYAPLSYAQKKAAEKAQRKIEQQGNKSFRGHDINMFFRKLKKNPQNKPAICNPSGGNTENCVRGGRGGRRAQRKRGQ